jgi:uncharacterized cupredoxin-like copper-binding protein
VAGVAGALAVTGVGVATADVHAAASKATVSADPSGNIAFTKHKLTVKHGTVTIVMKNPSSSGIDHGIAVAGHKVGKIVAPGKTSTLTLKLKAGKYTFYCPAPGHRGLGMKGRLVVK